VGAHGVVDAEAARGPRGLAGGRGVAVGDREGASALRGPFLTVVARASSGRRRPVGAPRTERIDGPADLLVDHRAVVTATVTGLAPE
jgi:hypothetical protein